MMLVASHFGKPRIISEVTKSHPGHVRAHRPIKLAGDLLVQLGENGAKWCPRRAVVRDGQLRVYGQKAASNGEIACCEMVRLPLRQLSLRSGPLPNSLSLCRGQNVVLTIQTSSEHLFDIWVKTIAIELIRQTPLEAVKYLDIFTLPNFALNQQRPTAPTPIPEECPPPPAVTDYNANCLEIDQVDSCSVCLQNKQVPKAAGDTDEKVVVETLLKKCQNAEMYVPVREKLILFESLCKLGRKVRSSEDVSCNKSEASVASAPSTKRARSLHDLTNFRHVKDICRYFEANNSANYTKTK